MHIFGRNSVIELLKTDRSVNKLYILKGIKKGPLHEILSLARERKIPLQEVDQAYFDKLIPDENHQGVLAAVATTDYVEWEDILERAKEKEDNPLIIILDEIEDPHNLGAVLRTCDAVGAHGVIIPKRRAVSLTEGVAKAAAGAVEHVPVARVANITQTIKRLKEEGLWIAGADMDGPSIYKQDLTMPLAIVIGSEGKGISRLVKENCDFLVSLPMRGSLNSLNASVAAGVIMYEVVRQRMASKN